MNSCSIRAKRPILTSVESLLSWDERTMLPDAAGPYRAEQMTLLAGMVHERRTDPRVGDWLGQLLGSPLAADPHSTPGATIRELKRQYDKHVKLPQALVEELTRTSVLGQQAWVAARAEQRFRLVSAAVGEDVPAETRAGPGARLSRTTVRRAARRFRAGGADERSGHGAARLCGSGLVPLVAEIAASSRRANIDMLDAAVSVDRPKRNSARRQRRRSASTSPAAGST